MTRTNTPAAARAATPAVSPRIMTPLPVRASVPELSYIVSPQPVDNFRVPETPPPQKGWMHAQWHTASPVRYRVLSAVISSKLTYSALVVSHCRQLFCLYEFHGETAGEDP